MPYDLHSDFDVQLHKQTFIDYLEVLILDDGKIIYAVPSHQLKGEEIASKRLGLSITEFRDSCPKDAMFDYLPWIASQANCVFVWNSYIVYSSINHKQYASLRKLKINGLYKGLLPNTDEILPTEGWNVNIHPCNHNGVYIFGKKKQIRLHMALMLSELQKQKNIFPLTLGKHIRDPAFSAVRLHTP